MRRWRARVIAEIIDHVFHRLDLRDDGLRRTFEQLARSVVKLVGKFHLQAFGRELDRRQRILDFVRHALRHFSPGGGALRRDQAGDVIKDHDKPAATRGRQHGATHQQGLRRAVGAVQLDLLLPFLDLILLMPGEIIGNRHGQHGVARPTVQRQVFKTRQVVIEDGLRTTVSGAQAKVRAEGQHTGGKVGQHAFQVGLRGLGRFAVAVGGGARLAELLRHAVERTRQ